MFGLLNVHKPAGPTSHDVVAAVRRRLPRRTKVGHAGTLDPFASGVLVLCVGPATRLAEHAMAGAKEYVATVVLGATSATDDPEGPITPTGAALPDEPAVRAALPAFTGTIQQAPPAHSAIKVDGQRAYRLARAAQAVELPARPVRIDALELLRFDGDRFDLRVACGSGTYIRALARDLGQHLGCGAYCGALARTRVGPFRIEQAVPLEDLVSAPDGPAGHLLPAHLAVVDRPRFGVPPEQVERLRRGQAIPLPPGVEAGELAALDDAQRLVALCHGDARTGTARPTRVFPPEPAGA